MTAAQLTEENGFTVFSGEGHLDRDVTCCYIGDMLSRVMGSAPTGSVWITIMSNRNVAAVATLSGAACVLLCEGVRPDAALQESAEENEVIILGTELSAYDAAKLLPF